MHGIKNKPKCKEDCTEHIFQLKNNNGNNKLETRISFCPKFKRDPTRPQKTIPQYNLDNRFYTHAFVLGTQKRALQNNAQHEQMHFQTMIKDACEKNNQVVQNMLKLVFPKSQLEEFLLLSVQIALSKLLRAYQQRTSSY